MRCKSLLLGCTYSHSESSGCCPVLFYGSQCGGHSTRTKFKAVLCEVKNAKRHIYIGIPAPIPSALQSTSFRLAITLILSPVVAVRFVRFYGSQCGGHFTRTKFKAVLCEVGYAKWHIYIVFQRLYQARCKSLRLGWHEL